MVEDNGQVGHRLREVGHLLELGEVQPPLEGEALGRQHTRPLAELVAGQLARHVVGRGIFYLGMRVPGYRVPDTPEMVGAGFVKSVQHTFHRVAQVQVGVPDDGRRGPGGAVQAAGAGRVQPLHELHLPYGAHFCRTIGPVHGPRLDEHGGSYVVPCVDVVGQFVEQVPLVGDAFRPLVPEVVVRVDDGNIRLKGFLLG